MPANRDIDSFVHVSVRAIDSAVGLVELLSRQVPRNVLRLEQRLPRVDGRDAMPELQVELPGHDDGVARELVIQGCPLLGRFVGILDRQDGAAAVGQRSDGILAA